MNDLVTPFLVVFLGEHLPGPVEGWTPDQLSPVSPAPAATRRRPRRALCCAEARLWRPQAVMAVRHDALDACVAPLQETLLDVEADCYWCLCKLIEGIQDHYTYSQPGIQRAVFKIEELVT